MIYHPWALLIGVPPILAVLILGWKAKHEDRQKRSPFTDSLLRPPGESCRQKIDELSDELTNQILWFIFPVIIALIGLYAPIDLISDVAFLVLSIGFTVFTSVRLMQSRREIQNYRLGFEGERAVGQELNQVLTYGGRVFHDVQFDGYNIDHVIVAQTGVFAVETKTRRKGFAKNSHRVKYDGEKLIFPEWNDVFGLEQASRNAKSLSTWISSAVGERTWVQPILTLPGWLVDRTGRGKVNVLNPKEIIGFIKSRNEQSTLSPQLIQRISHALEQKNYIS